MFFEKEFLIFQERPRLSAEKVTKSIRNRANPIETQIQNARGLLDGSVNAPVLKKEEFVLDWVLERLKSDKKIQYFCSLHRS
jgi:hypothetical protein